MNLTSGLARLHGALGAAWPCDCPALAGQLWRHLASADAGLGWDHDADPALATLVFAAAHHLRAGVACETGVARGVTTRFFLEATREWSGRIWSIDLPPVYQGWSHRAGELVPEEAISRWHVVRGSSRRRLPEVLGAADPVDLFIHDSLHTAPTVTLELRLAWTALSDDGVILVDDVDRHGGFDAWVAEAAPRDHWFVRHATKGGMVGVAVR
jgi:predicted O-methyltransferase YrrM